MAPVTPVQIFAGYELLASGATTTAQGVFIPLASLIDLTAAEADAATGDGRKVVFALIKEAQEQITALPDGSKPTKMTITKATPVGVNNTTIRQGMTLNFDLDISAVDVSPEA